MTNLIYGGAWLTIILTILSITILGATNHQIPNELTMAMSAAFGILGGIAAERINGNRSQTPDQRNSDHGDSTDTGVQHGV